MTGSKEEELGKGVLEGLIDALTDKHAQMEVQLKGLTVKLPGLASVIELNGTVTISMRLTDPKAP